VLRSYIGFIERHQRWFRLPLVGVMTLLAVVLAIVRPSFIEQIEFKTLDERFLLRGPRPPEVPVVIVAVDDASLDAIGRWPWPRDKIGDIVKRLLVHDHAKALGFDMVFSESQVNPVDETLRLMRGDGQHAPAVAAWLTAHSRDGDLDRQFEDLLRRFKDKIALGYFFYPQGSDPPPHILRRMSEETAMLQPSAISVTMTAYGKPVYARQYQLEGYEKEAGNYPGYMSIGDWGLDNGNGWAISGFIEDRRGRLRVYTHEENFACMSCHNAIGSTIDKTFSFPRKRDGAAGWSYLNLQGMPDVPNVGESRGEIATYLERVGGGSEFRNNEEMFERWFKPDGSLDEEKVSRARDVQDLITPSRERALMLNKAYYTIVQDQDYIFGKDATVVPPENVHRHIDNAKAKTLPEDRVFGWNILLDWESGSGK